MQHVRLNGISSKLTLTFSHRCTDLFLEQRDLDPHPETWDGGSRTGRLQEAEDSLGRSDAQAN